MNENNVRTYQHGNFSFIEEALETEQPTYRHLNRCDGDAGKRMDEGATRTVEISSAFRKLRFLPTL